MASILKPCGFSLFEPLNSPECSAGGKKHMYIYIDMYMESFFHVLSRGMATSCSRGVMDMPFLDFFGRMM